MKKNKDHLQSEKEEETKNSKSIKKQGSISKRTIIFHVMVWALVVLSILISAGVILKSYKSVEKKLEIIIDPVVVSVLGEDHVNNAQRFTLGPKDKAKKWTSKIEVGLSHNQYLIYYCTINCNGKKPFGVDLDISSDKLENISISYQIGDGEESNYENALNDLIVNSEESALIKIYIRILDEDKSAYFSGNMSINVSELKGVEK